MGGSHQHPDEHDEAEDGEDDADGDMVGGFLGNGLIEAGGFGERGVQDEADLVAGLIAGVILQVEFLGIRLEVIFIVDNRLLDQAAADGGLFHGLDGADGTRREAGIGLVKALLAAHGEEPDR